MTIAPVVAKVTVKALPDRAFELFSKHISDWWEKGKTIGKNPHVDIVIEPKAGGRWFERDAAGVECPWGKVLAWEPPHRIDYTWHLRVDAVDATEVEIRFLPADAGPRMEIEHRGWDRLGAIGPVRRDGNMSGWGSLLPHYRAAADTSHTRDSSSG